MSDASKNQASFVSDLVRQALLREKVERKFDIASNQAAGELRDLGPGALPAIESALMDALGAADEMQDRAHRFPGLPDVLVAYFDLARNHDVGPSERLLRSLPSPDQVHALKAIWSIWLGRSNTGPMPEGLLSAVREIAANVRAEASGTAYALLSAYSALGPRGRRASAEKAAGST